jgi:hypothetical protein
MTDYKPGEQAPTFVATLSLIIGYFVIYRFIAYTTLSLFVCHPGSVSVRETRFSRDKHLGTEGVLCIRIAKVINLKQHLIVWNGGSIC